MTPRTLTHIPALGEPEFYIGERCYITEILKSDLLPDLSLAQARVEPGVTTQLHGLDVEEIYILISGHGLMEGGDGQSFPVGPGDSVLIPPGTPQRITNTGDTDLVFYCLCRPRFRADGYTALGD